MKPEWTKGEWVGGLARWERDRTVYYSIAFTWKLDEAFSMALFDKALGNTPSVPSGFCLCHRRSSSSALMASPALRQHRAQP